MEQESTKIFSKHKLVNSFTHPVMKTVKSKYELRSRISKIGCMIIYAATYSIDANPVNQATAMIQNQEFNFSARMSSTWRILTYTARTRKNMESMEKLETKRKKTSSY